MFVKLSHVLSRVSNNLHTKFYLNRFSGLSVKSIFMANTDGGKDNWDDDRFYPAEYYGDESPVLSYRYEKYGRHTPYLPAKVEERDKRSTFTILAKVFLFCTAIIVFCVLMYIPIFNKANYHIPKSAASVAGWTIHKNRDTKIYVQPNNVTTLHEPKDVCPNKNKLFLLIIVCSSTVHFDRRLAIRETWGNYRNYIKASKLFNIVRERYKNYNYTYDLYPEVKNSTDNVTSVPSVNTRVKRDIAGFGQLLPELAKMWQHNQITKTDDVPEKRFEDDDDGSMLPEFDMNKQIGGNIEETSEENDYDYESNIMKIPPKGYEENTYLDKVLQKFRKAKIFPDVGDVDDGENEEVVGNTDPDFKLVFLLGMPFQDNETEVSSKIEEEFQEYGDIIQEGFIDSYNNLTLKSIMMLKWVTNRCGDSVRYILKTDDDMFINIPNLISNLRNRSQEFDNRVAKGFKDKEYMLIGDLICGARPVLDTNNKWYSPRYMYAGRVYPRYVSGTGYALSAAAAHALYAAALTTHYFHLEDIYITGMCSARARPRIVPRRSALFAYRDVRAAAPGAACRAHRLAAAHRVPPPALRTLQRRLLEPAVLDRCERERLTQIRRNRMRPKTPPKKH